MSEIAVMEHSKHDLAVQLDCRIKSTLQLVGTTMVEFCRQLKEMRDSALFMELGYTSFEEYTEKEVGLQYRQAFNYIKAYETLPQELIASGLGIKKLELLTRVGALDRAELIAGNDIEAITVKELQEQIKALQGENEQLRMSVPEDNFTIENIEDTEALHAEIDRLRKELEEQPTVTDVADTVEQAVAAAVAEAEAEKAKAVADAKTQAEEKAQRDMAKKIEKAQQEARAAAIEDVEKRAAAEREQLNAEKEAEAARAKELEKQLGLASSAEATAFALYFEQFSQVFEKMVQQIVLLKDKGMTEEAAKFKAALQKATAQLEEMAAAV